MVVNKTGLIMKLLLLIIVILIIVIAYAFVVRPAVIGYAVKAQNEGYAYAFASIMQQAATCQPVPLTFGNQTMNIIAVECLPPELFQQQTPQ
ncbi:hypothetical protein ES703_98516 [subsurface metagenome]